MNVNVGLGCQSPSAIEYRGIREQTVEQTLGDVQELAESVTKRSPPPRSR
jgi:hypothetical protein